MVEGFPRKDWADINGEDLLRIRKLRNMLLKWRLASHEWELPEVDLPVKGRLKELWKPIIQIASGLTVEKDLRSFLKQLQQERMNEKTNTLEGHIVKVVTELYVPNTPLSFVDIWDSLVGDLEGKLDDKKPNKMDTPEFGEVTKQKIGYRLREILSGKKKRRRGPEGLYWAYDFEEAKIKRIAKKYGYDFVLKFSSDSTSRGIFTAERPEKVHENNVDSMEKGLEKRVDTLQQVSPLENSRTDVKEGFEEPFLNNLAPTVENDVKVNLDTVQLEDLKAVFWSDEFYDLHPCCICGYTKLTSWQAETFKGNEVWICEDCKLEWEKGQGA
jgi:hypothetical protein